MPLCRFPRNRFDSGVASTACDRMLFNSAAFLLLFFAVYLTYWFLPVRGKHALIIVSSFIFYGWFSLPFLLLFLLLIVVNYAASVRLLQTRSKALLWTVVGVDIGILAFFKYFYLFAQSLGLALEWGFGYSYLANLRRNWLSDYDFEIILPIAISFYTFQIVAWVVDSYRGVLTERVPFVKFCVFILFFPQFVAGPIMRASDFLPQIDNPVPTRDRMLNGSLLLLQGILKKVLIADRIGALTHDVWQNPDRYDAVVLALILPAFVVRIYCDFSGYTDMARGLAKLLGYEIPENFESPLLARSMTEFWGRWHITLSTWLRDYIFIPLGGSRISEARTRMNILTTMGLAGLWHGASWTMLLWGLYIGIIQVAERFFFKRNIRVLPQNAAGHLVRHVWALLLFSTSTVLFAAPDLTRSWGILAGIGGAQIGKSIGSIETLVGLMILGFLLNFPQYWQWPRAWLSRQTALRYALVFAGTFVIGLLVNLYGDVSGSFIYFAF